MTNIALRKLGQHRLTAAWVAKEPTMPVLKDLMKDIGTPEADMLMGAIGLGLVILEDARSQGITFKSSDRAAHEMLQRPPSQIAIDITRLYAKNDKAALTKTLAAVSGALDSLRKKPYVPKLARNPEPAPVQTPAPSGPIEVKVVSSPARRTSSRVEYNIAGDIIGSQTVEIDAID